MCALASGLWLLSAIMMTSKVHAGAGLTRAMSGMEHEVTIKLPCRCVLCELPSCPQYVTCLPHAGGDAAAVMPGRQPERHAGSPAAARAFGRWQGPSRVVHRHMDEAHGADVVIRDADMHDSMEGPDSLSAPQVTITVSFDSQAYTFHAVPVLDSCCCQPHGYFGTLQLPVSAYSPVAAPGNLMWR